MTWDDYFFNLAHQVSLKSKDTTKVGCVIVGPDNEIRATGWNGFARGVQDTIPERNERPAKYDWTVHAESNCVASAARMGTALKGCTAYVTHFPCKNCAALLIQAGIVCVRTDSGTTATDHGQEIGRIQLEEAGVKVYGKA